MSFYYSVDDVDEPEKGAEGYGKYSSKEDEGYGKYSSNQAQYEVVDEEQDVMVATYVDVVQEEEEKGQNVARYIYEGAQLDEVLGQKETKLPPFLLEQKAKDEKHAHETKRQAKRSQLHDVLPPVLRPKETGSWNERFQALMDMDDCFEKFDCLRSTAADFCHAAEAYGRIIISERCLPDDTKSIKPIKIGGIAGGQKFIVQDILFKFAIDAEGIYNGDEGAAKGAGHDLNGAMNYLRAIEMRQKEKRILHVPLMSLIDYRGFRLVAICVLPISRGTICYGSYDAGTTVYSTFETCNAAMKEIGEIMNIKGHRIGRHETPLIYGPGDIEVHRCPAGHFYVLDFARYVPPQPPRKENPGESFYRLLRPELVSLSPEPLSPDAFSMIGHPDDGREGRNAIKAVFDMLVKPEQGGIIFDFASLLNNSDKSESEISENSIRWDWSVILQSCEVLVRELHARGINVRFLGLVRNCCSGENVRKLLLVECLARLWKCQLKHLWRDQMQLEVTPSEEPFKVVTVNFLNMIINNTPPEYWSMRVKVDLQQKFDKVLNAQEMEGDFFAECAGLRFFALQRLFLFIHLELQPKTFDAFHGSQLLTERTEFKEEFEFVTSDIVTMGCRTKHLNIIDKAEANAHMYHAARIKKEKPRAATRLLELALQKLLTVTKTSGGDFDLLLRVCECRIHIVRLSDRGVGAAQDALSALTRKLAKYKNHPLLPRVKRHAARLSLLIWQRNQLPETCKEQIALSWEAFESHATYAQSLEGSATVDESYLPYVTMLCKTIMAMYKYSRGAYLAMAVWFPHVHTLVDYCLDLSKLKASRARASFWLWWLLWVTATMQKEIMPSWAREKMLDDAIQYLSIAMSLDSNLGKKFLAAVNLADMEQFLGALSMADRSKAIFQLLHEHSKDWKEFKVVRFPGLHMDVLQSLVCLNANVTTLDFFESTFDVGVLGEMLKGTSRTLERLTLPNCEGGFAALGLLEETFPKLQKIKARSTNVTNADVASFLKKCPVIEKLDLSMTLVSFEASEPELCVDQWLPATVKWLDMGFSRNVWSAESFSKAARKEGPLCGLRFLGLAGSGIHDLVFFNILCDFPDLEGLDLCKCAFLTDRFVRKEVLTHLKINSVWLPRGHWWPCKPLGQQGTFHSRTVHISVGGRERFTAVRSGDHILIHSHCRATRRLHRQKLCNVKDVPMDFTHREYGPLYKLHVSRSAITLFEGEQSEGERICGLRVNHHVRVGHRTPLVSMYLEVESERTHIQFQTDMRTGKVTNLRLDLQSGQRVSIHPTQTGHSKRFTTNEVHGNPLLPFIALQAASAENAAECEFFVQ